MKSNIVILVDFDGTIFPNDVGNDIFKRFSKSKPLFNEIMRLWERREITSRDCLLAECSLVKIEEKKLREFVLTKSIDPNFKEFYRLSKDKNLPVAIFSDGLDYYINLLLEKENLTEIPFFSNRIKFLKHKGKISPFFTAIFPYFSYGCGRCGNCKCYHLSLYRSDGHSPIIYIGDGLSDICVSRYADIVFARASTTINKKGLRDYLEEKGKRYYPFKDFTDIVNTLFGEDSPIRDIL